MLDQAKEYVRVGDRVEFKKIVASAKDDELLPLLTISIKSDFNTLVWNEMKSRNMILELQRCNVQ